MDSQGSRRSTRKRARKQFFEGPVTAAVESAGADKDPSPNTRRSSRRRRGSLSESEDATNGSSEDPQQVENSSTTTARNSAKGHGDERSRDGQAFVIHRVERPETGSITPQGTNHLENGFRQPQKQVRDRPKRRDVKTRILWGVSRTVRFRVRGPTMPDKKFSRKLRFLVAQKGMETKMGL